MKDKFSNQKRNEPEMKTSAEQEYQPRKMLKIERTIDTSSENDEKKSDKCLSILQKLKNSYNFICKACGQHFQLRDSLIEHQKKHFEERQK